MRALAQHAVRECQGINTAADALQWFTCSNNVRVDTLQEVVLPNACWIMRSEPCADKILVVCAAGSWRIRSMTRRC